MCSDATKASQRNFTHACLQKESSHEYKSQRFSATLQLRPQPGFGATFLMPLRFLEKPSRFLHPVSVSCCTNLTDPGYTETRLWDLGTLWHHSCQIHSCLQYIQMNVLETWMYQESTGYCSMDTRGCASVWTPQLEISDLSEIYRYRYYILCNKHWYNKRNNIIRFVEFSFINQFVCHLVPNAGTTQNAAT